MVDYIDPEDPYMSPEELDDWAKAMDEEERVCQEEYERMVQEFGPDIQDLVSESRQTASTLVHHPEPAAGLKPLMCAASRCAFGGDLCCLSCTQINKCPSVCPEAERYTDPAHEGCPCLKAFIIEYCPRPARPIDWENNRHNRHHRHQTRKSDGSDDSDGTFTNLQREWGGANIQPGRPL